MNCCASFEHIDKKGGFNLIEIAIVMAVVGLIIGGIYVAAATVYKNVRESTTEDDLLQIVESVRNAYQSQGSLGNVSNSGVPLPNLIAAGILPSDMVSSIADTTTAVNAFGGTVTIGSASSADLSGFTISLSNIPQSVCIDILVQNTAGGTAGAAQTGLWSAGTTSGNSGNANFPLTIGGASDPNTYCNAPTNTVELTYGIRG